MKWLSSMLMMVALAACSGPQDQAASGNDAGSAIGTAESQNAAMMDAEAAALEAAADNLEAIANEAEASGTSTTAWTYREDRDRMRGGTNKIASVGAIEPINLAFPYGTSTPSLNIRQDAKYGFDIYMSANGQFLCRAYNDDTLSVKFDDEPIREWACTDADGGSSDIVFIRNAKAFLGKLKSARSVTIEAPMYEAGRQQMTFNVSELKW